MSDEHESPYDCLDTLRAYITLLEQRRDRVEAENARLRQLVAELTKERDRLRESMRKAYAVVKQDKIFDCSWCGECAYILGKALQEAVSDE